MQIFKSVRNTRLNEPSDDKTAKSRTFQEVEPKYWSKLSSFPIPYLQFFGIVDETGEHDDAQHKEEHEQSQFLSGRLKRMYQNLKTGRVSRQLEQSQYANDAEKV